MTKISKTSRSQTEFGNACLPSGMAIECETLFRSTGSGKKGIAIIDQSKK